MWDNDRWKETTRTIPIIYIVSFNHVDLDASNSSLNISPLSDGIEKSIKKLHWRPFQFNLYEKVYLGFNISL